MTNSENIKISISLVLVNIILLALLLINTEETKSHEIQVV